MQKMETNLMTAEAAKYAAVALAPTDLERERPDRTANTVRKEVKLKLTPLATQKNLSTERDRVRSFIAPREL